MKNLGGMGTRLFLLSILLFAFIRLSGQNDGLYLNVRLYPVQILSIGSNGETHKNHEAGGQGQKYITVSSIAGFEVNVQQMNAHDKLNIINSTKGAVQEVFTIDERMQKIMRKVYTSSSIKSDHLFLTLISQ